MKQKSVMYILIGSLPSPWGLHICTNTRLLSCLKFSINHTHFLLTLKIMQPLTHFTTTVNPAAEHVILAVSLNAINTILKLF